MFRVPTSVGLFRSLKKSPTKVATLTPFRHSVATALLNKSLFCLVVIRNTQCHVLLNRAISPGLRRILLTTPRCCSSSAIILHAYSSMNTEQVRTMVQSRPSCLSNSLYSEIENKQWRFTKLAKELFSLGSDSHTSHEILKASVGS